LKKPASNVAFKLFISGHSLFFIGVKCAGTTRFRSN
jgi:hypothetical protein